MLTLTRKLGESIIIQTTDGEIDIFVDSHVKISFDAQYNVNILRRELLDLETP